MTRNNGLDNETYKLTRGISLECLGVLRFDKEYGMWIKYSRRRKLLDLLLFFFNCKEGVYAWDDIYGLLHLPTLNKEFLYTYTTHII